jgi:GxxExxY protein
MKEKKFDKLSNQLIGKAIEVHKTLGPGFNESIYQNALIIEFEEAKIHLETEKEIPIYYRGEVVGIHRIDIKADNKIILELKAVSDITDVHVAQVVSYLKATGLNIGLILNFAKSKLEIRRVVYDSDVQKFLKTKLQ